MVDFQEFPRCKKFSIIGSPQEGHFARVWLLDYNRIQRLVISGMIKKCANAAVMFSGNLKDVCNFLKKILEKGFSENFLGMLFEKKYRKIMVFHCFLQHAWPSDRQAYFFDKLEKSKNLKNINFEDRRISPKFIPVKKNLLARFLSWFKARLQYFDDIMLSHCKLLPKRMFVGSICDDANASGCV